MESGKQGIDDESWIICDSYEVSVGNGRLVVVVRG